MLTADAFAVVALVRGTAKANESSMVASELYKDVAKVPFAFTLDFDPARIDSTVTYTIQAMIVDGDNAWVTAKGIPVLTKGNPSTVAATLTYRPDALKGAVSGQITAIGMQPTADAYAIAVLVDPATGDSLGMDVRPADEGLPVAFSVPYQINDIVPTNDYVVTAEVYDTAGTWRNAAGVPVITNGNPKTAIQVVVTEVVIASPSPSAAPAAPSPSPAPVPPAEDTGSGGLLTAIILIALAGAIAAFFIARGRNQSDTLTPDDTPPDATTTPADATGDLGATEQTIPPAAPAGTEPSTAPEPPATTEPSADGPDRPGVP